MEVVAVDAGHFLGREATHADLTIFCDSEARDGQARPKEICSSSGPQRDGFDIVGFQIQVDDQGVLMVMGSKGR